MAHDGYARSICLAHTMYDGDSIHAMTTGTVPADVTAVGILASYAMSEAILNAARNAESAYGLRGIKSISG
jgi:L-aminopeptidase/D-esterase-like protein